MIYDLQFIIHNFYMKHDQVLKPLIKIVAGRHNTWSQLLKKAFKGGPEVKKKRDVSRRNETIEHLLIFLI